MSSPAADTSPERSATARLEIAAASAFAAAEQALADGRTADISDVTVQRLIAAGVRLYAHKVEHERRDLSPLPSPGAITATDAVVVLSGMLRALNLNLFDLSMWMDGRSSR